MALDSGTRLGNYEIAESLGAGGMGEVYRAIDSRLGRSVAIKVLPAVFAEDPDRVARFEREARLLAALNHPHIAALHGLESVDGRHLLVMELVEGDTLAQRIERGPLPPEEALEFARQIAEALETAHEKGIIHRDLKPANVKVTSGSKAKVLDFGLAKAMEPGNPQSTALMNSPTLSLAATQAGIILGTAAYMAPEQAKGFAADHRSDIFSFGCVVFEMLTGRQAFQGDSMTDIIASVIKSEPDLALLPSGLHPRIRELLGRCLAKDPRRRWHAIADVRVELDSILSDPRGLKAEPLPAPAAQPLWKRLVPIAATAVITAAIAGVAGWWLRPAATNPVRRFSMLLPEEQRLTRTGRHNIAISPDGLSIVYVADNQLMLRRMGDVDARPIQGTNQDINTPFFSPDGQWVAFYAVPEQRLKKVAISGGASVTIADFSNPYGASWGGDDQILLGQGDRGIARVSANGGKVQTLIPAKSGEVMHGPQLLPDGDHVLFTVTRDASNARWDHAQIVVQSLASGERKVLIDGGSDARYVATGHLLYALGSNMLAVPFDADASELRGGPVPVIERVMRSSAANTAASFFAVSRDGVLAYFVGDNPDAVVTRTIVSVDRRGARSPLPVAAGPHVEPRLSPDGRQLVTVIDDGKGELNLWIHDLAGRVAPRRLTFGGSSTSPAWTADGRQVLFISTREGGRPAIFKQNADGAGAAERVGPGDGAVPTNDVFPSVDGNLVLFRDSNRGTGDVMMLPLKGEAKAKPVIEGPNNQLQASLSPDGRWVAYVSDEGGIGQVFVQPFPPNGAKYQVFNGRDGARAPLWAPDGKRLFYLEYLANNLARLVSVDVQTQSGFSFGNRAVITENVDRGAGAWPYAVTSDGEHFLAVFRGDTASERVPRAEMRITLNWFEELKQRVPAK